MVKPLPLSAVRALALHTQGLDASPESTPAPTPDAIYNVVDQVGCVQIDTLHVVQRAQYIAIWSRLGRYDPADFDRLIFDPADRRLFEYWQHAASIIPLKDYRHRLGKMQGTDIGDGWWPTWAHDPNNLALAEQVRERIRQEGPLRVSDFENPTEKRGSWWDWKPAKQALEYLYNRGELMISNRVNFHRIYDLRERTLPEWVDTSEPTREETQRYLIERAIKALGICEPDHALYYTDEIRRRLREGRAIVKKLLAEGVAVEVMGEQMDGQAVPMIVHRDLLPLVQQAADGAIRAERTTFLSFFDSLFWARGRDESLWGFHNTIEAYKHEADRIWGYFCLPILHRDRLVGRFDPKLERKTGTLRLKALHFEPGIEPSEELLADVAGAMRDFMAFHAAQDLVIERCTLDGFGSKLIGAL